MSKILLSNGCSWVNGAGLKDRNNERWSHHLSKKMNMKDINISSEGASNDTITRTTIEWFTKNQVDFKDVFVVIGWTQFTRAEFFNDVTQEYENQNFVSFGDSKTDKTTEDFFEKQSKMMLRPSDLTPTHTWWRVYLKYYFNFEKKLTDYVNNVLFLQSFFKSNNINFLQYQSFGEGHKDVISNKLIDNNLFISEMMDDSILDQSDDSGHPGLKSHQQWSNTLYDNIKGLKYEKE
tara:strand:+ start:10328 stop:11032 length:705 start_codon:yes stop_codon:yes gene_type:complete